MRLQVGDTVWHLHFRTTEAESDDSRMARNLSPLLWHTETRCGVHSGPCILSTGTPEERYCVNGSVGKAKCSKKDSFVRCVGNRLALTQAIEHLSEDTRKAIWEAYWQRVRRPKESSEEFQRRLRPNKVLRDLNNMQAVLNTEGHPV